MPKTRRNKLQPSAAKTRKHRKQSGGVIIDKVPSTDEIANHIRFQIQNFGITEDYQADVALHKKKQQENVPQELEDIISLQTLYKSSSPAQQETIKKILANSIYEDGSQNNYKINDIPLGKERELLPIYMSSKIYKNFVDKLCFPKLESTHSVKIYTPRTAINERIAENEAMVNKQKLEIDNKSVKARLAELNNTYGKAPTNIGKPPETQIENAEKEAEKIYGPNWKNFIGFDIGSDIRMKQLKKWKQEQAEQAKQAKQAEQVRKEEAEAERKKNNSNGSNDFEIVEVPKSAKSQTQGSAKSQTQGSAKSQTQGSAKSQTQGSAKVR